MQTISLSTSLLKCQSWQMLWVVCNCVQMLLVSGCVSRSLSLMQTRLSCCSLPPKPSQLSSFMAPRPDCKSCHLRLCTTLESWWSNTWGCKAAGMHHFRFAQIRHLLTTDACACHFLRTGACTQTAEPYYFYGNLQATFPTKSFYYICCGLWNYAISS